MKKVLNFGKVDYEGTGRLENVVTIEIEYKEKKEGQKVLSICGNIWNRRKSDTISGGQNLDEILRVLPENETIKKIHSIWKKWHLNDMYAECEHQEKFGWNEKAGEKVKIYTYKMTSETITKQNKIERAVIEKVKNGEIVQLQGEDLRIYNLNYSFETYEEIETLEYKLDKTEEKTLGWLKESEHPDGILSKECPICGYKYGHSWNYRQIPEEIEKEIYKLLEA